MKKPTPRQAAILSFIEEYRDRYAISPSFKDIQERFRFRSPNAVSKHLQALKQKGYIHTQQGSRFSKARSILPTKRRDKTVPLVGRIAAGAPVESVENVESRLDLSSLGIDNIGGDHFALKVKGDSMINAHILEGDIVVIRKQADVDSHAVAVVLWNGEATLKYVRRQKGRILLVPANDSMKPIPVEPAGVETFQVLGKVVSVIRNYQNR